MRVVIVKPNTEAYAADIEQELSAYQNIVGGYIEVVYPFDDNAVLVVNDEGKLNGNPFNRYLRDSNGEPYDALMGSFFIVGDDGEGDFCSLTDEQIDKYTDMFHCPDNRTHPRLEEPHVTFYPFSMDDFLAMIGG